MFFKIDTTTQFIHRLRTDSTLRLLCGFEKVPGKSTFSRNFTALSETPVMSGTLDRLVKEAHTGQVVYNVSRDSTAIQARENAEKKPRKEEKKRGRPKKGEVRPPKPETVIEKQVHEGVEESLKYVDTPCAHGCKKNNYEWYSFGPVTNRILMSATSAFRSARNNCSARSFPNTDNKKSPPQSGGELNP